MGLIDTLVQLQTIDLEWDEKGRQYQAAKRELTDQSALESRQAEQREREQKLSAVRGELRSAELEIASLRAKAAEVEKDLYSGKVASPRELENLKQESEQLASRLASQEEAALGLMDQVEQLNDAVETGSRELTEFVEAYQIRRQTLARIYQTLRARLQEIQAERNQLRGLVSPRTLALYDELRKSKSGQALSPLRDGRCQTCLVTVPSSKAAHVRAGDRAETCDGCDRILYRP